MSLRHPYGESLCQRKSVFSLSFLCFFAADCFFHVNRTPGQFGRRSAAACTEEDLGWTPRRREYPLPAQRAQRGEGQGETAPNFLRALRP